MRWIVECVWSGYVSSQSRPCHCAIIHNKKEAANTAKIHTVEFTDHTTMSVSVRQLAPREKVQEHKAYTDLLRNFRLRDMEGYVRVADLRQKGQAQ